MRPPDHFSSSVLRRQCLTARDNQVCRGCGVDVSGEPWEADHVVPAHLGGADVASNLQTLCLPCHRVKTAGEATDRARARGHHRATPFTLYLTPEQRASLREAADRKGVALSTYIREAALGAAQAAAVALLLCLGCDAGEYAAEPDTVAVEGRCQAVAACGVPCRDLPGGVEFFDCVAECGDPAPYVPAECAGELEAVDGLALCLVQTRPDCTPSQCGEVEADLLSCIANAG